MSNINAALEFPVEYSISKHVPTSDLQKLLLARSYIDESKQVIVLLDKDETSDKSIAAHVPSKYKLPLHILSYRCNLYRDTINIITGSNVQIDCKEVIQQLAHLLQYFDGVRRAYINESRRTNSKAPQWYSPILEYHLWLDYTQRAYHDEARKRLLSKNRVAFKDVVNRKGANIIDYSESIQ